MYGRGPFELPFPTMLPDAGRLPFVGRHSVWPMLEHAWAEVRGRGQGLVLLGGEPGVGKTRLATEFARRVHSDGAVVLAGRCDEEIGFAYQPFLGALAHCAVHLQPEALRRILGPLGGELRRLRPELAAEVPGLPEPLAGDENTERYRLFNAVAGWLSALSEDAPVVVLIGRSSRHAYVPLASSQRVIYSQGVGTIDVEEVYVATRALLSTARTSALFAT